LQIFFGAQISKLAVMEVQFETYRGQAFLGHPSLAYLKEIWVHKRRESDLL